MTKPAFAIYTDGKTAILHAPEMGKAPAAPFKKMLDGAPEQAATFGAWATRLYHARHHYGNCTALLYAVQERDWDTLDTFMAGIQGWEGTTPLIPFADGANLGKLPNEARKSIMLALYNRAMRELAEHIYSVHGYAQPAAENWEHICGVLGVPSWGDAQNLAHTLDELAQVRKGQGYGVRTRGWLADVQRRCQQPDFMGGYLQEWHVQRTIDKAMTKKAA